MKITVIALEKIKSKYQVTFDNDTSIVANENLVLKYRLVKGHELELDEFQEALVENEYFDYYDKALSYLERGLKSKKKIYDYLVSKGASQDASNRITEELLNKKLLDDTKYAQMLTDYYVRQGYGEMYIKQKGLQNGVEKTVMEMALSEIDDESYLVSISKLIKKNEKSYKKLEPFKRKQKLITYLLNHGFSYNLINKGMKDGNYEEE